MKSNLFLFQLAGLTFTAVLGTLLHFLYAWTNAISLAPFSAVNESTWEHMKILFFSMFFFTIISYFIIGKTYTSFWQIKFLGTLIAVVLIPVLFYTISGAFGKTPDWANILIFFLSAGVGYFIEMQLFKKNAEFSSPSWIFIALFLLFALTFALFTFFPPKIPLFQDPLTSRYGI